ncbi:MAG TPA: MFS transporter [Thermoplasmata archaeon]|nr:MFS transporter [Thermoplasmata archaeon]
MAGTFRQIRWLPRGNVRTISAANFLTGMYQSVLNVILQPFILSFGVGVSAVGLLQAVASRLGGLVGALVQPFGGYLADTRGRRPLAILGSGLTIGALALLVAGAFAPPQPWALAALVFPGFLLMALALISSPALQSAVAESTDPRRRASAYATTAFFWVLPGALLAIPVGVVADRLGYGAVFGIALAFEVVNLILFASLLQETSGAVKTVQPARPWRERLGLDIRPSREVFGLYVISAMDAFAWGLAAMIIYGILRQTYGFSNTELTVIGAVWSLSFAIFLPPTAIFVNRFGPKRSILFSEFLGIPIMLGWIYSTRVEHFALVSVLGGLTAATWVPALQTYLANWTSTEERARVTGGLAAFRGLVAFPAPFIGGLLFDAYGYAIPIQANLVGAIATTVAIAVLLRDPPPAGVDRMAMPSAK